MFGWVFFSNFVRCSVHRSLNEDIVDFLMGHRGRYDRAYFGAKGQKIREIYSEYEPFLSIDTITETDTDKEIKNLKEKINLFEKEHKLLQLLLWQIAGAENYDFDPDDAIGKFLWYMDTSHGNIREQDIDYILDIFVKGKKYKKKRR